MSDAAWSFAGVVLAALIGLASKWILRQPVRERRALPTAAEYESLLRRAELLEARHHQLEVDRDRLTGEMRKQARDVDELRASLRDYSYEVHLYRSLLSDLADTWPALGPWIQEKRDAIENAIAKRRRR